MKLADLFKKYLDRTRPAGNPTVEIWSPFNGYLTGVEIVYCTQQEQDEIAEFLQANNQEWIGPNGTPVFLGRVWMVPE